MEEFYKSVGFLSQIWPLSIIHKFLVGLRSGCRDVGMSGFRDVGMLGCWDVGMLGCRDVGKAIPECDVFGITEVFSTRSTLTLMHMMSVR